MTQPDLALILAYDALGHPCAVRAHSYIDSFRGFDWLATPDGGKTWHSTKVAANTPVFAYVSGKSNTPIVLTIGGYRLQASGSGDNLSDWPPPVGAFSAFSGAGPLGATIIGGAAPKTQGAGGDFGKVSLLLNYRGLIQDSGFSGGTSYTYTLYLMHSYDDGRSFSNSQTKLLPLTGLQFFYNGNQISGDVPRVLPHMVPPALAPGIALYETGLPGFHGFENVPPITVNPATGKVAGAVSNAAQSFQPAALCYGDSADMLYLVGFYEMVHLASGNHFGMPFVLRSPDCGQSWTCYDPAQPAIRLGGFPMKPGVVKYVDPYLTAETWNSVNGQPAVHSAVNNSGPVPSFTTSAGVPPLQSLLFPVVDKNGMPLAMPVIPPASPQLEDGYGTLTAGNPLINPGAQACLAFAHGTLYLAYTLRRGRDAGPSYLDASGHVQPYANQAHWPWTLVKSGDLGRTWSLCTAPPSAGYGALAVDRASGRLRWNLTHTSSDDGLTWIAN